MSPDLLLAYSGKAALALMSLSMVLAFFRVVRGPSLGDRVVALDLISTLTVGMIASYSVVSDRPSLMRTALVVALITFLATIAFAQYLEKGVFLRRK